MVPPVSVAAVHDKLICVLEAAVAARLVGAVGMVTVKAALLLAIPPTVTTTLPVVAPLGTDVLTLLAAQLEGMAATPLNVTVLVPCVAPKLTPVMVTDAPIGAAVGLTPVIFGATLNVSELLNCPFTTTWMGPLVAPTGTATTIDDALQLVGTAKTPLKDTVLEP